MRNLLNPGFTIFLFTLIFSCERDATIPPPSTERKLVLSAMLSPDDARISVYFGWTAPIFLKKPKNDQRISNGIVKISGPDGFKILPYNPDVDRFEIDQSEFQLKPGATFLIEAKEEGGKIARAQITLPERTPTAFEIRIIDSTTVTNSDGNPGKRYVFHIRFQNNDNASAIYQVFGSQLFLQQDSYSGMPDTSFYPLNTGNDSYFLQGSLGASITTTLNNNTDFQPYGANRTNHFVFYLFKGNNDFKEFQEIPYSSGGDDPFSEPVTNKSNVEGGLGYVAGYLKEKIVLNK